MKQQLLQPTNQPPPPNTTQLTIKEIKPKIAQRLNQLWHSKLPNIPESNIQRNTHKICYAINHNNETIGVAIWTSPVAQNRFKNGKTILELRRLALSPKCPKNTASKTISQMTKHIRKKFPEITRLISYQDTSVHTGTIYKASNWKPATTTQFKTWTTRKKRHKDQATGEKIRWEYQLKKEDD